MSKNVLPLKQVFILRKSFFASVLLVAALWILPLARAQEDPLNKVHVPPPSTAPAPTKEPKGAEAPALTGSDAAGKIRPGSVIRMNVDDIRQIGRQTEGVRVIRLEEGDEVRTIERVQKNTASRKPRDPNKDAQLALMSGKDGAENTSGEDDEDEFEDEELEEGGEE